MKKIKLIALMFWGLTLSGVSEENVVSVGGQNENLLVKTVEGLIPDKSGFIMSSKVKLPAFEKGCYYRPFTGGKHGGANGNRVSAVAFDSIEQLSQYKPSKTRKGEKNLSFGQFILLKVNDEKYLSLLPVVSGTTVSLFFIENKNLVLKTGNFGTDKITGKVPTLAWAYGKSPYESTMAAWKKVLDSGYVETDWRMNKEYPEMYKYLGWCSWEHYRAGINEQNMVEAANVIENGKAPIRWFMVDDGYLTQEKSRLINFDPVEKKFPNGWKAITSLKKPEKIRWMGLWRNMMGYMGGISFENNMKNLAPYLESNKRKSCMVPKATDEASTAFYDEMVGKAKDGGFDFVKVDFQSRAFQMHYGMGSPVAMMRQNNLALENSCKKMNMPLLNCIAQCNVNVFNTKYSSLLRTSRDYSKHNADTNKCITYQSFANHLWAGQVLWGDLDMFHCTDKMQRSFAIARAISGGPIYISETYPFYRTNS